MQNLSFSKDQLLLSQAREHLSQLVDDVEKGIRPGISIIKDGQSKAILISTEMYEQLTMDRQSILDAIETSFGLLEGLKDYRKGKVLNEDQFFTKIKHQNGKPKKS